MVIVALTADSLPSDRQQCLAAGMDDFLSKPFDVPALATVLERWRGARGNRVQAGQSLAGPSVADDDDAIDRAQLARLAELGGAGGGAFARRVVTLFLREVENDLPALLAAMAAGDLEEVTRLAHRLKSGSANVGAERLARTLQQLELKARTNRAEEALALTAETATEVGRVQQALAAFAA